jgi:hypothetical protein
MEAGDSVGVGVAGRVAGCSTFSSAGLITGADIGPAVSGLGIKPV